MSGDYARWLATETAAALTHDPDDGCLTHVPMVCTTCRKPVEEIAPEDPDVPGWHHVSAFDGTVCPASLARVMAMVEAGNENVPRKEAGQ